MSATVAIEQRNLFAPDGPAKATPWLDGVLEWLTSEADSGAKSSEFLPSAVPGGFLEKTSPEFCRSTAGEIGLPYSETWRSAGMGSPTGFLTLNISESPSGAVASSLSDVLETGDVPPKFYLSPRAASGILRRAAKRGRELPPALHAALTALAGADTPDEGEKTT